MSSQGPSSPGLDETLAAPDSLDPPRRAMALQRGQSVGRYVVLDKIGQGGMGIVYAAYDPELDRRVALKLLAPGPEGNTAGREDRARLLREAQAMAKLAHPHVVTVHDAGTFEGAVFLAMEFVAGGTLAAKIVERTDWRTTLRWLIEAGTGLAAAHAVGLVHRDFKPDNVLLTGDGVAKVSDFGLARAVAGPEVATDPGLRPVQDVLSSQITRVGALVGTPAYMSPEQHLHHPLDAKSDQFSFCVVLHEALFGERPFRAASLSELAYAVTTGRIADPPQDASAPSRLRRVALRGLAVDPNDRFATMDDLLEALRFDPSRRRARLVAAGAIGVAVLGGWGGLAAIDRRDRAACEREAQAVAALWNAERSSTIATALEATRVPFAETSIARIDALLAPWTAQWAEARTAACLGARDGDEEVVALQRSCLDERLAHLEVLLEVLESADVGIATSAVQNVAALPRIDPCRDVAWLRRSPNASLDANAAHGAEIAVSIARLTALVHARRMDRARPLADELLAATAELPALRAEVLYRMGQLAQHDGRPADAQRHLSEAYFLAGRSHADRVAALAAIDLTMLIGVRTGDLVGGRSWADHATMMVERDPDPGLRIELLYAVGALESTAEHNDVAAEYFREQVQLATELYGEEHPETGYAHVALGNAYSTARHAEARAEYERARTIWERTLGAHHPSVASVIFSLATLDFHEGDYAASLEHHREALAMREATIGPDHPETAASRDAIGSVLGQTGDHDGALAQHQRALATFELHYGKDSPRVLGSLHNIAQDLIDLGRLDEADEVVERRCQVAATTKTENPEPWLLCLLQRAQLAELGGRPTEAARLHEQTVEIATRLYGPRNVETGTRRYGWGRALLAAGEPKRALVELEAAVAIWRDTRADTHPDVRTAFVVIGHAQQALGDESAAHASFERAIALVPEGPAAATERASLRRAIAAGQSP